MQKRTEDSSNPRHKSEKENPRENKSEAREKAKQDIKMDPDMKPDPKSDLDEGELARLGDGKNDLA